MSERDERWYVTVGAGSPADPDARSGGDDGSDVPGCTPPPGDIVRAVVAFVDDLVEDSPAADNDQ